MKVFSLLKLMKYGVKNIKNHSVCWQSAAWNTMLMKESSDENEQTCLGDRTYKWIQLLFKTVVRRKDPRSFSSIFS